MPFSLRTSRTILTISQTRSFAYNLMEELLGATNPETGTVYCSATAGNVSAFYGYDANGNLAVKLAAAGSSSVTTTYSYDALDRVTTKSYNDGATLYATYCYDGAAWGGTNGLCSGSAGSPSIGRSTTAAPVRWAGFLDVTGKRTDGIVDVQQPASADYDPGGRAVNRWWRGDRRAGRRISTTTT